RSEDVIRLGFADEVSFDGQHDQWLFAPRPTVHSWTYPRGVVQGSAHSTDASGFGDPGFVPLHTHAPRSGHIHRFFCPLSAVYASPSAPPSDGRFARPPASPGRTRCW